MPKINIRKRDENEVETLIDVLFYDLGREVPNIGEKLLVIRPSKSVGYIIKDKVVNYRISIDLIVESEIDLFI